MSRTSRGEGSIYFTEDKGWRGFVSVDGKRKYFTAPTKAEAARKRRSLLNQRDSGQIVAGKAPSFDELLELWMDATEVDRRPSTNANYRTYIKKHIRPALGSKQIDKIVAEDLDALYKKMRRAGLAGSTQRIAHSIIRTALSHAVQRRMLMQNVALLVKPPKRDKPKTTTFSEADTLAIYRALEGDRFQARWHLSLDLGLRPGEAMAIEWKHVNFRDFSISIEQEIIQVDGAGAQFFDYTKTEAGGRVIAVPPRIMAMLRVTRDEQMIERAELGDDWQVWEPDGKPHSWCFTRRGGLPLKPTADTRLWKQLVERAGLPHTRRYTARHTAASMALTAGADVVTVADMMGHSSPTLTMNVYTHAVEERKRSLADLIELRHMETSDS